MTNTTQINQHAKEKQSFVLSSLSKIEYIDLSYHLLLILDFTFHLLE